MSEADYAGLIAAAHKGTPGPDHPEGVWANMKNGLGNLAARDVEQLAAIIKNRLKSIQYRPALIEGFLAQTGLTLQPGPP
jgi:putative transposase